MDWGVKLAEDAAGGALSPGDDTPGLPTSDTEPLPQAAPRPTIEEVHSLAFAQARRSQVSKETSWDIAQMTAAVYYGAGDRILRPFAFVRTYVARRCASYRARRRRFVPLETLPHEPRAEGFERSVEQLALQHDVLALLAPRDRSFVSLVIEGRTHREIARQMGIPVGQVGTYIRRARNRAAACSRQLAPSQR